MTNSWDLPNLSQLRALDRIARVPIDRPQIVTDEGFEDIGIHVNRRGLRMLHHMVADLVEHSKHSDPESPWALRERMHNDRHSEIAVTLMVHPTTLPAFRDTLRLELDRSISNTKRLRKILNEADAALKREAE